MSRRRLTPVMKRIRVALDVHKEGDECWVWTGATSSGYGVVGLGRRIDGTGLVHRIVYEHWVGPIPAGLDLDHLCRNRACCSPYHLEPVTRQENADRGARRKGYAQRLRTGCPRGHGPYDRRNAKQRYCSHCHREDAKARRRRRADALTPPAQEAAA